MSADPLCEPDRGRGGEISGWGVSDDMNPLLAEPDPATFDQGRQNGRDPIRLTEGRKKGPSSLRQGCRLDGIEPRDTVP